MAIVATHNEERFIGGCLSHLCAHGVQCYLIDNESTDATVQIAARWEGHGLIGIESFPRGGVYPWRSLLARKAELATELDADWALHVDADERYVPPRPGSTLSDALHEAAAAGDNAVSFVEYAFVPTIETPNHDHPEFERTMRWYYPASAGAPYVRAWRPSGEAVELVRSGGHEAEFDGRRVHPVAFGMRHYLYLSPEHAIRKYVHRAYDPDELAAGWHRARAALRAERIRLLPEVALRRYDGDETLDASDPWSRHPLFDSAPAAALLPGAESPDPVPPG